MDALEQELDLLMRRYGRSVQHPELTKLRTAMARHKVELDRLNEELDRVHRRRRITLEAVEKLERLQAEVLRQAVAHERARRNEAWSPVPILAFRAWIVADNLLYGVFDPWETPSMVATCHTVDEIDEVPHTDGRCGLPPCGIYALKRTVDLLPVTGWHKEPIAIGLVALSGKVVEHELGYRAEVADVVALAYPRGSDLLLITDREELVTVFAGDASELEDTPHSMNSHVAMCQWLEERKEKQEQWTLGSKTA